MFCARDGLIFVKENVVLEGRARRDFECNSAWCDGQWGVCGHQSRQWIVDRDDNSISRTDAMYKDGERLGIVQESWLCNVSQKVPAHQEIFRKAGLLLQHELKQDMVEGCNRSSQNICPVV